jgi:hypothetical protein
MAGSARKLDDGIGRSRIASVAAALENYARRGLFRGFSQKLEHERATFKLLWHRDRVFDFIFDVSKNTMSLPVVLPNVPANSEIYENLKRFVQAQHAPSLPEHRRIDSRKARVTTHNRKGNVSLTLTVKKGEDEYGARKLIHLVHEIFLTFLSDGRYFDYMVENFDLDPDHPI